MDSFWGVLDVLNILGGHGCILRRCPDQIWKSEIAEEGLIRKTSESYQWYSARSSSIFSFFLLNFFLLFLFLSLSLSNVPFYFLFIFMHKNT